MKIITTPSPILRKKSLKVKKIDSYIKGLIKDMLKILKGASAVGLAAPQVGELVRIIIIEWRGNENVPAIPLTILINPEIIECSKENSIDEEGCLSVPNIWGKVNRPRMVMVSAIDKNGKPLTIKADGLFARTLQHEIDHLNGVLFTDKADLNTLHKIGPNGEMIRIKL